PRRARQASAAQSARPPRAARDPRAPQARLRGADRRVAPWAALSNGRGPAVRRPAARSRPVQRARGRAPVARTPCGTGGSPSPVVAAHDARTLVPSVRRSRAGGARPLRGGHLTMCGIAGLVAPDRLHADERARLIDMRDVLAHRGPDEAGLYSDEHAGLAHRRLSIVDLAQGHQPLANEDGT